MALKVVPQLALDEIAVTNAELEAALERRLRAHDDEAEAHGVFKDADDEVKVHLAKIDGFDVDTVLRVGRFRITKVHREGGSVQFERKASDRISIALVED